MGTWNVTTDNATSPVSVSEMNDHHRLSNTTAAQDSVMSGFIETATKESEDYCGRTFMTDTIELVLDGFFDADYVRGGCILLPRPPIVSVSSIQYLDENGASQTWDASNYQLDTKSEPGRIMPKDGQSFPSTQANTLNSVTITYQAGYGAAVDVPERIKTAIKHYAAHLFESRTYTEPMRVMTVPETWRHLLDRFRVSFST